MFKPYRPNNVFDAVRNLNAMYFDIKHIVMLASADFEKQYNSKPTRLMLTSFQMRIIDEQHKILKYFGRLEEKTQFHFFGLPTEYSKHFMLVNDKGEAIDLCRFKMFSEYMSDRNKDSQEDGVIFDFDPVC